MTDTGDERLPRDKRNRAYAGLVRKYQNLNPAAADDVDAPDGFVEEARELSGMGGITLPQMIAIARRGPGTPAEIRARGRLPHQGLRVSGGGGAPGPRWGEGVTSSFPPCYGCIHLHPRPNDVEGRLLHPGHRCNAYPDGIPERIIVRGRSHDIPNGDEVDGIVFKPDPANEAYNLWRAWFYDPDRPPVPTVEEVQVAREKLRQGDPTEP